MLCGRPRIIRSWIDCYFICRLNSSWNVNNMNDLKKPLLIPEYIQSFRCIGSGCQSAPCCSAGMNVDIDRETYEKYKNCKEAGLEPLFQKNIIKGILSSLGDLPLDVIGSFSDIVSYIRLFAVGFASFIVASSFNTMAVGSGIDNVVSGIIAAVIMFLGHTLNIALCGMAVLVHGVRLNMLEFSGHVGVQWTGKPYEPFKE